ncbi:unnamed protein product [Arabis nemorensis]|uniref:RRM domain-containing protein n=1 Tax=Arabis nemorensis TaxID=586526 RepID=A0A565CVX8_9BRAS|nr:unnamed protein product [Arabis nemorensis]
MYALGRMRNDMIWCSDLIHGSDSVESANKEIALWFPDGPVNVPDAAKPKQRDIGRISVTGFDTGIPDEDVESALRKQFASCGKITDVYIQKRPCVAYIYFVGEGAVDKALELSGSDVGGWNVFAKAYPFMDNESTSLIVQGYDTSLTESEIDHLSREHFSSCGEITKVMILKKRAAVVVDIKGFDAVDKALELNGSNLGKRKVLVACLSRPPRYTVNERLTCSLRGPRFQKRRL